MFEKYKHNLVEVKEQSNSDFIWANEHYHMTGGMICLKRGRSEQNGQDNKCPCSSQNKIIIHFAVAAHEYKNVLGERFLADDSKIYDGPLASGFKNQQMYNDVTAKYHIYLSANVVFPLNKGLCPLL